MTNDTKTDKWGSVRLSKKTITRLKRTLAYARKNTDPTLTLDILVDSALDSFFAKNGYDNEAIRRMRVPEDGRAAGAQARAARSAQV